MNKDKESEVVLKKMEIPFYKSKEERMADIKPIIQS